MHNTLLVTTALLVIGIRQLLIYFQIQIQKGVLKHIHIYHNLTQYDSTKMITNIDYPL